MKYEQLQERLKRLEHVVCLLIEEQRSPYNYLLPQELEKALKRIRKDLKEQEDAQ